MKCLKCGNELLDNEKFCTMCGTKAPEKDVESGMQESNLVDDDSVVVDALFDNEAKKDVTVGVSEPVDGTVALNFAHDISLVWPEWRLEKQLGRGSYGVVYKAIRKDSNVVSHAAIKVISIPSDSSEVDSIRNEGLDLDGTKTFFKGIVDDFVSEIQLMESLKGIQNIVSVEDYKVLEKKNEIGWDIYIRMELLTSFNACIADKQMDEDAVIKLGCDICTALDICSQRNIIHRDVKPENIFVNDFGFFKLGDFGIARKLENMTGGLSQKGTFNYMAPEVASSFAYDARADIYSLGIVLYRLLNGNRLPFINSDQQLMNPSERRIAVERRLRGDDLPAPCNASPQMANVILRACAFDADKRFNSAAEMKQALMSVKAGTYVMVDLSNDRTTNVRKPSSDNVQEGIGGTNTAPKKSKGKKALIISIAAAVAVVALTVAILVTIFGGAAHATYGLVTEEKYSDAVAEFYDGVEDNFIQKMILKSKLGSYDEEIVEKYNNGEITYKSAVDGLDSLDTMGFEAAKDKVAGILDSETTKVVEEFNAEAMSYEKAYNTLENVFELGCTAAASKMTEISETYADRIFAEYENGDLGVKEAVDELEIAKSRGSEKAQGLILNIYDMRASAIVEEYRAGTLSYEDAISELSSLSSSGCKTASQRSQEVNNIRDADTALEKGEEYAESGKHGEAIREYSKIDEKNENYENAQKKLNELYPKYISATVTKAKEYIKNKQYKEAVIYLNNSYVTIPEGVDTSDLDAVKAESLALYKTQITDQVTEHIKEDEYSEAFAVIDAAIEVDDNTEFRNLRTSTETKYVASITAKVQKYLESEDYISAARVAENSLTVLPDNPDLKALVEKVEKETPTYLLDVCSPYESKGYAQYINGETITMGGKTYTNAFTLTQDYRGDGDMYAIFNISEQYTTLSFTVGHLDGTGMNNCNIKIYCDGVLKTEFSVKCDELPQRVSIDVTGVNQIKIVKSDGGEQHYGFANVTVK